MSNQKENKDYFLNKFLMPRFGIIILCTTVNAQIAADYLSGVFFAVFAFSVLAFLSYKELSQKVKV